ncbi:ribosomal RNA methyltransferase RrmJ/FtsJ domain [Trichoderma guizhouense]|uniref:rRNA methyltransferase 2, mitochondrial n=1 Tax=Trichoderma guizhouense TaxID=1491466 RepID=A0A1T3C4I8_9HYPO|nr:ribosomal RNA methyltransferase RrmJ/FtsJ domain [Trichoderma guizhouense]
MLRPYQAVPRSLRLILRPCALTSHVAPLSSALRLNGARPSSSGTQWKQRQGRDAYVRHAKVQGLKSRAAFKLLEIDAKYKLFKKGQTVVDLGYAPGSWSQVAVDRTRPHGRVIGIDLIPAQPPQGVAAFQGDFLSPIVQKLVKEFIAQSHSDRLPKAGRDDVDEDGDNTIIDQPSYIDRERHSAESSGSPSDSASTESTSRNLVDVVLSDMLMNTSGIASRDHAGSMNLCEAALHFASDTLKPGGHLVCKFYTGAMDKSLEQQLKVLFSEVYREKPESSRAESKEAYFVALYRKAKATIDH